MSYGIDLNRMRIESAKVALRQRQELLVLLQQAREEGDKRRARRLEMMAKRLDKMISEYGLRGVVQRDEDQQRIDRLVAILTTGTNEPPPPGGDEG